MTDQALWTRGVVRVAEARGFVVGNDRQRFVITAAHCLPDLEPSDGAALLGERIFEGVLGPLSDEKPSVSAVCLFADPVADVAILGSPVKKFYDAALAYEQLVNASTALKLADPRLVPEPLRFPTGRILRDPLKATLPAWLLSLSGTWFRCRVRASGPALWVEDAAADLIGGMSGSPIITDDGAAVGIMCQATAKRAGGPNPFVARAVPGWFLAEVAQTAP